MLRSLAIAAGLTIALGTVRAQPITFVPTAGPRGGSTDAVLQTGDSSVVQIQDGRLFVSLDAGRTWMAPSLPGNARFRQEIALRRGADGSAYAIGYTGGRDQAFASTDAGLTWKPLEGLDLNETKQVRTASQGWFRAGSYSSSASVLRSTDGGATWTYAGQGIPRPSFSSSTSSRSVSFLGAARSDVPIVEVATRLSIYDPPTYAAYGWDSASQQWQARPTLPGPLSSMAYARDGASYAVMGSGSVVYESLDGGLTWARVHVTSALSGVPVAVVAATPEGVVYAGTRDGVFRREANGVWVRHGLNGQVVNRLAAGTDGTLYAGSGNVGNTVSTFGSGLHRRRPHRETWEVAVPEVSTSFVYALSGDGQTAALGFGAARRDSGAWRPVPADVVTNFQYRHTYPRPSGVSWAEAWERALLTVGDEPTGIPYPSGSDVLALGDSTVLRLGYFGMGLERSRNRGRAWTAVEGLSGVLALTRRRDGRLFAGGTQTLNASIPGLWTSSDDGATWTRLSPPNGVGQLSTVAARDGTTTLYVGAQSLYFRSDDEGRTWTALPSTSLTYRHLTVESRSGWLFAASRGDVMLLRPNDAQWQTLVFRSSSMNTPAPLIPDWYWPVAADSAGFVVVASPEGGLLRSATPVTVAPDARSTARLRVWPSPARGVVRVDGVADAGEAVTMTVFNTLGQEVYRLTANVQDLAWDSRTAAPGMYGIRVQSRDGVPRSVSVMVVR